MKLYLGVVPGFYPWEHEPLIKKQMKKQKYGIIFSFWQFRNKIPCIIQKGIHDYFSFGGPIMIDSGAYSAHNSEVKIDIKEYISFLTKVSLEKNDMIVNLDVIGCEKESKRNWKLLTSNLDREILPVIHFPSLKSDYQKQAYIGLGGMVSSLKINEKGSVYDVASWIAKLRNSTNQKFHGFGLGSPFHQIVFKKFLNSLDWMGWRRNAAMGDCYTPEGSRSIPGVRKSNKGRKVLSSELFYSYQPPFIDDIKLLQLPGTSGFKNQALWNVWIFLNTHKYDSMLSRSKYVNSIKRRIKREENTQVKKKWKKRPENA